MEIKKTMQKEVTSEMMTITPQMAQSWLNNNPYNRKVNNGNVRKMVEDMNNGNWKQCTDAIAFDVEGNLCNGQHRLLALIKANKSFKFPVMKNLSKSDFPTMDIGYKRTPVDALSVLGVKYAKVKANVIKKVFGLRSGKWVATGNGDTNFTASGKGGSIQVRTINEYKLKTKMYDDIVPYFLKFDKAQFRKYTSLTTTDICGFMIYLYENGVPFSETDTFFSLLLNILDKEEKQNVITEKLFKTLKTHTENYNNKVAQKISPKHIQSLIAKGWNMYHNGEKMKKNQAFYLNEKEFANGVKFEV